MPDEKKRTREAVMKSILPGDVRAQVRNSRAGRVHATRATVPAAQLQDALSELADVTQALANDDLEFQPESIGTANQR